MDNLAESLIAIMTSHLQFAFIISVTLNIIVAIFGLVPSIFITMANIVVFGPFGGLFASICGEAAGAVVSFIIYRKGFKEISSDLIHKNKRVEQIMMTTGSKSRRLIFSFRLMPYMPSGIVTYAAAISQINLLDFTISSTAGKIPALIVEVILSIGLIKATTLPINTILTIVSTILIVYILYSILKKPKKDQQ